MKEKNVKKIGIIVGIILFALCLIGVGYAFYQKLIATISVNTITKGLDYYINYNKGQDITNGVLELSDDYSEGLNTTVTFYKKDNTYDIYGHIYLDITTVSDSLSNSDALKYTVVKGSEVIDSNYLIGISSNSSRLIAANIPLSTSEKEFTIYLWLDSNEDISYDIEDAELRAKIRCEATMKPISTVYVGKTRNFDNFFNKTGTVTSNSIVHDIDETHQLIKDPAGNIRYYGTGISDTSTTYKEPDNYIDIGDNVLWRIIGVFDGKLKLIRSTYITSDNNVSGFSWDTSVSTVNSGYGINEWSQADLMKLLNPGYENNQDLNSSGTSVAVNNSLWYNSQSGTCYNSSSNTTTSCNFTNSGLSNSVKNKIAEVTWNTGGWNTAQVYPNLIYEKERGTTVVVPGTTCSGTYCNDTVSRTTSWTGKIGLAYSSDYGYATDLQECNQNLYNYSNEGTNNTYPCRGNNWMWRVMTGASIATSTSGTKDAWLLTPNSSYACHAWVVNTSGNVSSYLVYAAIAVSPVLYLNSEQVIESGSGTSSDPYVLSA